MLSNHRQNVIILLTIFLFASFPLLLSPFFQSHDGTLDIIRMAQYIESLSDGQFPVRWGANFNFGFGSPIFNFFYPLPAILASLLYFLGQNLTVSYRLIMLVSFTLAPIFFYLWLERYHKPAALVAAVSYGLAPYHLLDLYVRGNSGETLAFALLPLVFLTIDRAKKLIPLFYALLILSHNILSLTFTPIIFLYAAYKDKRAIIGLLFGLLLSAFFWFPAVFESRYVFSSILSTNLFAQNFPTFWQLIYSPWDLGPDVTKPGGLSVQIGPVIWAIVIVSVTVFWRRRNFFTLLGLLSFAAGVFFSQPVSTFFWQHLPLMRNFQFPWRFIALASFGASLLVFPLCKSVKPQFTVLVLVVIIIGSAPFVKVLPTKSLPDSYFLSYQGTPEYHWESLPIWTAGYPTAPAKYPVTITSGKGEVKSVSRKSSVHSYTISASTAVEILDNTIFFPGWRVQNNGQDVPIQFQNANHPGLISFTLPRGQNNVRVYFSETGIRKVADLLSLLAAIVYLAWYTASKKWGSGLSFLF